VVIETVIVDDAIILSVMIMAEIYEYVFHKFLREHDGSALKNEIYKVSGDGVASGRMIDEKLRMMERFGIVTINGREVKV